APRRGRAGPGRGAAAGAPGPPLQPPELDEQAGGEEGGQQRQRQRDPTHAAGARNGGPDRPRGEEGRQHAARDHAQLALEAGPMLGDQRPQGLAGGVRTVRAQVGTHGNHLASSYGTCPAGRPPGGRTTAFTCRAGCKERDVSENRNAGPVKCNPLFGGDRHGTSSRYFSPEASRMNSAIFGCFLANPWNPFSLGSTFDRSTSSWVTRTSPPFVETRSKVPLARS